MSDRRRWSVASAFAITSIFIVGLRGGSLAIGDTGTEAVAVPAKALARSLRRIGTMRLPGPASNAAPPAVSELVIDQGIRATAVNRRIPSQIIGRASIANATPSIVTIPLVPSTPIASSSSIQIFGFNGLNALDSGIGNGLSIINPTVGHGIEPPDQGLCTNGVQIVEMTNLEMAIYDPISGALQSGPTKLSAVFSVPDTDFLSDPKCYFDAPTNTFYMTLTDLQDINALNHSSLLVAMLRAGSTTVTDYAIDTTNDGTNGTPTHPGCPCFGDQPLLGADQFGIYVTTNEFALNVVINPSSTVFNGSQIYAINKADLAAAAPQIDYFFLEGPLPLANGIAASMQPSASPDGDFDAANGGTEFFMNSLDFDGHGDDRIALWAMTNTCAIPSSTATPCAGNINITLTPPPLHVRNYSNPPPAIQETGSIPFGASIGQTERSIDTGDDRLQLLVYADGKLYTGLNTTVRVRAPFTPTGRFGLSPGTSRRLGSTIQAGIEFLVVKPSIATRLRGGQRVSVLVPTVLRDGIVAHADDDLYYPSIGATTEGPALMVFSISGASLFPSAANFTLGSSGLGRINIVKAGAGPDDGITGYTDESGREAARWGDYSAAVASGGEIWTATEYIPSSCTSTTYGSDPLCGMTRAPDANWGTYISKHIPPVCTAAAPCTCGPQQPFNSLPCAPRTGTPPVSR
jgi:hypothetical protein